MTLVVDASAVVELLTRSGAGDRVARALEREQTVAPELLDVEVLHAFRGLARRGAVGEEDAGAAVRALAALPIARVGHAPLLEPAWQLRANLTAYDALYVALARRLDATLLTADARLARAPGLAVPVTLVAA